MTGPGRPSDFLRVRLNPPRWWTDRHAPGRGGSEAGAGGSSGGRSAGGCGARGPVLGFLRRKG
jgi:hypothetical protein